MHVLLLRPPRYVWPFNSENSAFWPPLGLLSLAGCVRRKMPEVDVQVWDAPGERMGWRTLEHQLAARRIDVLGIGEETVSAHEGLRAARMVKRHHPQCVVVAGGVYFSHAVERTLATGCVDVIVRGEGEATFVELLGHVGDRSRWEQIPGLAFSDGSRSVVRTRPRRLIDDLDSLPTPAWDLIDVSAYGRGSRNHPALVSIEHSRGCIDRCAFCILWRHMGEAEGANGAVRPRLRTKSPQRSFEEVRHLYYRFARRTFGWVDPTFNASPEWSDGWAERMLRSELVTRRGAKTLHTGWVRPDCVVRDEKLGILGKLVRAGMRQVMIGVERDDPRGLEALDKHNNSPEICRNAFAIFREKYPQVYTIGTLVYGLPGDTLEDLRRLIACRYEMGMDYCFIMPLTPNPGTAVAESAAEGEYIANDDLSSYNFHTPVCRTDTLNLRELESVYWRIMLSGDRRRFLQAGRELLFERDRRKRRVSRALLGRGTRIAARSLIRSILHPKDAQPTVYSRKPSWYDT